MKPTHSASLLLTVLAASIHASPLPQNYASPPSIRPSGKKPVSTFNSLVRFYARGQDHASHEHAPRTRRQSCPCRDKANMEIEMNKAILLLNGGYRSSPGSTALLRRDDCVCPGDEIHSDNGVLSQEEIKLLMANGTGMTQSDVEGLIRQSGGKLTPPPKKPEEKLSEVDINNVILLQNGGFTASKSTDPDQIQDDYQTQ